MLWSCLMLPQTDRKSTRVIITQPMLLHIQLSTSHLWTALYTQVQTELDRNGVLQNHAGFRPEVPVPSDQSWLPRLNLGRHPACRASRPTSPTLNIFTKHSIPNHAAGSAQVKSELLHFQRNPALGFTTRTADQGFEILRRTAHQEP